ncbi:hypothetical protein VUR80DRAFT_9543 [Thermomyces stellatus]
MAKGLFNTLVAGRLTSTREWDLGLPRAELGLAGSTWRGVGFRGCSSSSRSDQASFRPRRAGIRRSTRSGERRAEVGKALGLRSNAVAQAPESGAIERIIIYAIAKERRLADACGGWGLQGQGQQRQHGCRVNPACLLCATGNWPALRFPEPLSRLSSVET